MSEKIRALSLTTGNVLTALATTSSVTPPTSATLIGAPTLISSTFNASYPIQMLTPMTGGGTAAADASPQNRGGADIYTDSSAELTSGAIMAQLKFHLVPADAIAADGGVAGIGDGVGNSIMNSSQISATSNESAAAAGAGALSPDAIAGGGDTVTTISNKPNAGKHLKAHSVAGKTCRFPKLEECAHFHYERVQLGPLSVRLLDDKSELLTSSIASQSIGGDIASHTNNALNSSNANANATLNAAGPTSLRSFSPSNCWFIIRVFPHQSDPFLVKRSFDNMQMFDEMLHRCVYDRKISGLKNLQELDFKSEEDVEYAVAKYLERFSKIASDSLTCGTILTWLQLDNKGRRLPLADSETMRTINTPAVGAAYGVRRYQAQACDEISIEVGDMISVIDMPSPAESIWWRGKKSHLQKSHYEVGFFPQACVATIGDKVPRNFPMPAPLVGQLDVSPTKPVLRKHGKLIAFFRSFILSRPSRRRLKQSGIYRERVFSCDLSEHLLNSGQEIPMVLKCCAEFLEEYGIVDGIYRLSGITSNIQRLRRAFDEERVPDLGNPEMKQDIHAVSSLLKMYFRELPNPLCTYQLYDNFVEAIQEKSESTERLRLMKETVLKLPPPHYRTLKYLSEHLNKISQHAARTNMTDKNLAIVWAPNLLRSPALESGGVAALRGVGVQAVVTEYLIRNCHNIFDALDDPNARLSYIATAGAMPNVVTNVETRLDSLTDCESLLVEQREHDQSLSFCERPKSLSAGGPKLISLEEAQERHSRPEPLDLKQSMPMSMIASNAANIGSYIEVGGGPSSLPDKYHTVLDPPRNWQKRKTHSWKSIFTRSQRPVSSGTHDLKTSGLNVAGSQRKSSNVGVQVTFAETDSIINGANGVDSVKKTAGKASLSKQEKPKSIDLFETSRDGLSKPMDICVRSNSIDSLRTATGHSRSVSHDSYFDLLQSPQRGNATTCPSRELSELGINFDREEPEMRIFSESESLVSSPRVGKENIPPSSAVASRRILRARPEDFSSQTNSVNPSPKKQPRLNLLLSPSSAAAPAAGSSANSSNWTQSVASTNDNVDAACHDMHANHSGDESCCKRYKLEDQLSDIQFIDCSTPEHTIANSNNQATTLFTSVQVHAPPNSSAAMSKSSLYDEPESSRAKERNPSAPNSIEKPINTRYSYPSVQLGAKRKEKDNSSNTKDRFSYPSACIGNKIIAEQRGYGRSNHMQVEEDCSDVALTPQLRNNLPYGPAPPKPPHLPKPQRISHELISPRNRNSFCGTNDTLSVSECLAASGNMITDPKCKEMERSKRSVTPSSPMNSPRYSLLTSETSSEHSSAVNTPQYDLDPLMVTSAMSGLSGLSGASSQQQHQYLLGVDAISLCTSHESIGSNVFTSQSPHHEHHHTTDKRDMHALKRELSLDLNSHNHKVSYEQTDGINGLASNLMSSHRLQQQLVPSPSNTSNFTDNTSQSVTPSEFGYQHLQRQSSMLLETSENSPAYEDYENTPSNLASPLGSIGNNANRLPSPIKSTISITYNLKSPKHEKHFQGSHQPDCRHEKTLLETSFDENTVYEQVRFFKNSVTEVNELLSENQKAGMMQEISEEECITEKDMHELNRSPDADVEMHVQNIDSLEDDSYENVSFKEKCNNDNEKLLYENVELRKPKSIYANLMGEEMRAGLREQAAEHSASATDKLDVDSLDSLKVSLDGDDNRNGTVCDNEELRIALPIAPARKSPSNFSVKELATKFETSPVEQLPAFDFTVRGSMKKSPQHFGNELKASSQNNLPCHEKPTSPKAIPPSPPAKPQSKPKLIKTQQQQQITRSLDENAFIREFGSKQLQEASTRSTQLLPETMALLESTSNRRKSFDFTRPKLLNPPKRLPGMPIAEEVHTKRNEIIKPHKSSMSPTKSSDLCKEYNSNNTDTMISLNEMSSLEHDFESSELKITPTTENRISLIQQNSLTNDSNLNNAGVGSNNGGLLSGVKLDRERIDRIKEERRQQLTQKYAGETFKSKSKIDLHTSNKDDGEKLLLESLRLKSKSRGDVRESLKDFERTAMASAGSESTLPCVTQRVRSISDEKNQNCLGTAASTVDSSPKKTTNPTQKEEFSTRTTALIFERKSLELSNGGGAGNAYGSIRERRSDIINITGNPSNLSRNSSSSTREKISPQFSIRDVTAMFESRAQNQ